MKRLDNKVAIVTGASKGIGAGIAKALGAEGATVIVNYARDQAGAERVVARKRVPVWRGRGSHLYGCAMDSDHITLTAGFECSCPAATWVALRQLGLPYGNLGCPTATR